MRQLGTMIAVILFAVAGAGASETLGDTGRFRDAREQMVRRQIESRGISDWQVLDAMRKVLRHQFVSERLQPQAYEDHPLPIGEGQTISQPYIVALMTESLDLKPHHRVLEIGTGSGYQAAILAEIVSEVYTMEIKPALHQVATAALKRMNYSRVFTRCADGYFGWPESAPFDAVMITAAIDHIPPPLLEQLKVGGRLILPLGNPFSYQNLTVVTKTEKEYTVKQVLGVLFVPMTGHALGGKR